jgi:hypothetical protein
MKRLIYSFAACATLVSCTNWTGSDEQSVGEFDENGQALDVTQTGSLTRSQGTSLANDTSEPSRQNDTLSYYTNTVFSGSNKIAGTTTNLNTLDKFKTKYGFGAVTPTANETVTYYYNRGDLGIGREMHCVDTLTATGGQAACYVKNFAAGDADSEFQFGLSSNIAFDNMNAHNEFATVAMAYRHELGTAANNVIFVVYKKDGSLLNSAALDRTGLLYATGANTTSIPGQDFNNHIPSNCASCHGGAQYNAGTHSLPKALFLPFDLDQFEYESADPKSRAFQEAAFRKQNALVWKVAAFSGADAGDSLGEQLERWYTRDSPPVPIHQETLSESGFFDSDAVPSGWSDYPDFYKGVVRGSCRSCHVANSKPFNDAFSFAVFASKSVDELCAFTMPHALQTVRLFWQSSQPEQFAKFLESGPIPNPTQAARLRACGPGNVATLDPPQIMAAIARNLLDP